MIGRAVIEYCDNGPPVREMNSFQLLSDRLVCILKLISYSRWRDQYCSCTVTDIMV